MHLLFVIVKVSSNTNSLTFVMGEPFKSVAVAKAAREVCGEDRQCLADVSVTGELRVGRLDEYLLDEFQKRRAGNVGEYSMK